MSGRLTAVDQALVVASSPREPPIHSLIGRISG